MNPEAPAATNSENFGTERDVANCPFFLKTGACRFGDRFCLCLFYFYFKNIAYELNIKYIASNALPKGTILCMWWFISIHKRRCSRKHIYPTSSPTLLVRGMFKTFGMEESRRDDYDMDACLEHSEEELLDSFLEFYHDVLPEFKSIGKVVQFKVTGDKSVH